MKESSQRIPTRYFFQNEKVALIFEDKLREEGVQYFKDYAAPHFNIEVASSDKKVADRIFSDLFNKESGELRELR